MLSVGKRMLGYEYSPGSLKKNTRRHLVVYRLWVYLLCWTLFNHCLKAVRAYVVVLLLSCMTQAYTMHTNLPLSHLKRNSLSVQEAARDGILCFPSKNQGYIHNLISSLSWCTLTPPSGTHIPHSLIYPVWRCGTHRTVRPEWNINTLLTVGRTV